MGHHHARRAQTDAGSLAWGCGSGRRRLAPTRTQAGRRTLALEDAGRQVAFARTGGNAWKQLADCSEAEQQSHSRAVAWLEEASALVAESTRPSIEDKPAITLHRLFLAYRSKPHRDGPSHRLLFLSIQIVVAPLRTCEARSLSESGTYSHAFGLRIGQESSPVVAVGTWSGANAVEPKRISAKNG
jgi:hypothetical protein